MDSADFRKILGKYIEGNCNESERKTVDEWLDQLSAHGNRVIQNPLKQEDTTIINTSNFSKTPRLADGSDVTLYPNSKLTHVSFTEGERRMRLEGKAFFKVAPNPKRPFIIVTERLITKVLGTSFTIRAEKGEAETVAVKTGKVAVYKSANAALENLPG